MSWIIAGYRFRYSRGLPEGFDKPENNLFMPGQPCIKPSGCFLINPEYKLVLQLARQFWTKRRISYNFQHPGKFLLGNKGGTFKDNRDKIRLGAVIPTGNAAKLEHIQKLPENFPATGRFQPAEFTQPSVIKKKGQEQQRIQNTKPDKKEQVSVFLKADTVQGNPQKLAGSTFTAPKAEI